MSTSEAGQQIGVIDEIHKSARSADLAMFQKARPRGRPKTRTPDFYANLLREYQRIRDWHQSAYGESPSSDPVLLSRYLAFQFENNGLRANRVLQADIQSKVKTIRNQLSIARRLFSRVP